VSAGLLDNSSDIAIVGMAAHFPGAGNVEEFWENLCAGVESVRTYGAAELRAAGVRDSLLRQPDYVRAGVPLGGLDAFDAGFFGISRKDAAIMDPQQRHFLECAWEAMEHAGYAPGTVAGSVGVFAGCGPNAYLIFNLLSDRELLEREGIFLLRHTGNDKDVLATRVSYQMDLRGPSINVQTACSTSLVAVHMAVQSLLSHECDVALAGAVSIEIPHAVGYLFREGEILAQDGHCRPFDAAATGTVFGSGAGAIVLRRLSDALKAGDTIHAVIKGSAVNNDGSRKVGFFAPSIDGQIDVISEALAVAGVDPATVDYVEAHGTGTAVGDPIELTALGQVFAGERRPLLVGSVKSNIGHLDTAAGMAGLIKTVLSLSRRRLPPTLHFREPNPRVDFTRLNVRVVDQLSDWENQSGVRRAGVTSLGIGGTNAHVVLEEAPLRVPSSPGRPVRLLTLSAKSQAALDASTRDLAAHLSANPGTDLDDAAFTLHVGRTAFPHRRAVVCLDTADAVRALESLDPRSVSADGAGAAREKPVAFLFTGQGSQYVNMGRGLYEREPVFRRWIDECATLAQPHLGLDLREVLYPGADAVDAAERIRQTWNTQPALFAVEYALAQMWMSWGVRPAKLIGHSIGEYVAACIAGIFSLEDAIAIVCARGLLMREVSGGSMLAIAQRESELAPMTNGHLSLAAVNAPDQCVVAGSAEAIAALAARLEARGIQARALQTSHAFHSSLMDPVLVPFTEVVTRRRLAPPQIPVLSNVSGTWLSDAEATDPSYWARHLRSTVRFREGLEVLLGEPELTLLEVGPGDTLASLARLHPGRDPEQSVHASLPRAAESGSENAVVQLTLGKLWAEGARIDWAAFHAHERRQRIPLPTYPFERRNFWMGPLNAVALQSAEIPSVSHWFQQRTWTPAELPAAPRRPGSWLIFADAAGIGEAMAARLRLDGITATTVSAGAAWASSGTDAFTLDPGAERDYDVLLERLAERGLPSTVVYLWALDDWGRPEDRCFYGLLSLLQRLEAHATDRLVQVGAVSRRAVSVDGEPVLEPMGALLAGPCRVMTQESSELRCRQIDVERGEPGALAGLLLGELAADTSAAAVAYRGGRRHCERVEPRHLEPGARRLREHGTYLITGGLSGIGLEVADWLAREYQAQLVLVSREAEARAADLGERLAQWESRGARVLVCSADVTNSESMRSVIDRARAQFGEVNGVIHAAGVLNDGVIPLKTRAGAQRVLSPKVDGTRVLDELLRDVPLDFMALFSSVSALEPPGGQVDYCAANAFLNAFAESRPPERNVVAIGWGPWAQTGMAARAALPSGPSAPFGHPLIERVERETGGADAVYAGTLSLERDWILQGHRFHDGDALLPGTAHLELVVAAAARKLGGFPLLLRDVIFQAPLHVVAGVPRPLRLELSASGQGDAYRFSIGDGSTTFASGSCEAGSPARPSLDVKAVERNCAARVVERPANVRQDAYFDFGLRWKSLERIAFGTGECLGTLELPPQFRGDVSDFVLHPALMDMATGLAMFLIPGYDAPGDLMLPFSYRKLTVCGALPARVYSHARVRHAAGPDLATFDITIAGEDGLVVAEIEEFAVRRIPAATAREFTSRPGDAPSAAETALASSGGPLRIGTRDGLEALRRILTARVSGTVFVAPSELRVPALAAPPAPRAAQPAPGVEVADDVERTLAAIWKRLLGVKNVAPDDDFYESGGHSLVAVRLFSEIRKTFNVSLGISTLFEAHTLGTLAGAIRSARAPVAAATTERRIPGVLPLQPNGSKAPLFLIHDIGGSVFNYMELVKAFPPDQPVYGVESPGLHGSTPYHRVEDMAAHYIERMRAVQPAGPYFVVGHSFGGQVAYEIGRQLTASGLAVGLIGIMDTFSARIGTQLKKKDPAQFFLLDGRMEFAKATRLRIVRVGYRSTYRWLRRFGLRMPRALINVEQANWVAFHDYSPQPADVRIVLYRCQTRSEWDHPEFLMGWDGVARGGVDVCEIPGDHRSMIRQPGVRLVAEHLSACVGRASR
jgi:acyl transferase domain-containing protein/thioesterase domain-containing protein/acyl carrier protein